MINPAKIGFTFAFISAFSLLSVSTSAWAMPKSPGFVDADAKAIPVASFAPEPYVLIISVKCISPTLGSDTDSIYFSLSNGLKHPAASEKPRKIRAGETWRPHFFASAAKKLDIVLLESDTLGGDDRIGTFTFNPSNAVGRFTEKMTGDFSEYEVVFEFRR